MPGADAVDLDRLRRLLEQARRDRRLLTYLQVADALELPPPHRIHRTTVLVEGLLEQDIEAGRTPIAALVVSKVRSGRPAPGFFDRAQRLGIRDAADPDAYHERLLLKLFDTGDSAG